MGKRPEPAGRGEQIAVSQHPGHQQEALWRDGWLTGQAPGSQDRATRGQAAWRGDSSGEEPMHGDRAGDH